jgi:hypothetical protein
MADDAVLSSNFLWKRKSLLQEFTRGLQCAYGSVCAWVTSVQKWAKHFKDGGIQHRRSASGRSSSNSLWTRQGKSGWDHSRWQACETDCGHNSPKTWAQCRAILAKVCACRAPRLLTEDPTMVQRNEGDDFLLWTDRWQKLVSPFPSLMEWHHLHYPSKAKASAANVFCREVYSGRIRRTWAINQSMLLDMSAKAPSCVAR